MHESFYKRPHGQPLLGFVCSQIIAAPPANGRICWGRLNTHITRGHRKPVKDAIKQGFYSYIRVDLDSVLLPKKPVLVLQAATCIPLEKKCPLCPLVPVWTQNSKRPISITNSHANTKPLTDPLGLDFSPVQLLQCAKSARPDPWLVSSTGIV